MLNKYTPQPNTMDMGGMTMMGQPTVVGAGNDANNYLDVRKQRMIQRPGHGSQSTTTSAMATALSSVIRLLASTASIPQRVCPDSASITTTSRSTGSWRGTTYFPHDL